MRGATATVAAVVVAAAAVLAGLLAACSGVTVVPVDPVTGLPQPGFPEEPPPTTSRGLTTTTEPAAGTDLAALAGDPALAGARRRMVEEQIRARGIADPRVLVAMEEVPRHLFVPAPRRSRAYADEPLPIGHRQTISQPYVVALMSELLELDPDDRVLEIGTGSGYHAAVLSRLAGRVYTMEIVEPLAARARSTLAQLGYDNVEVRSGDGYRGWPGAAPFDAILLTAAPARIPEPLLAQLADGGRLVVPVGEGVQELTRITRRGDDLETERIATVFFVPMTGEAERRSGTP